MALFHMEGNGGFVPPSTADFNLPPIFGNNPYTTKPIFLVFLSVFVVSAFFIIASRKAAVVPGKLQFAGESIYGFVLSLPSYGQDTSVGGTNQFIQAIADKTTLLLEVKYTVPVPLEPKVKSTLVSDPCAEIVTGLPVVLPETCK